MSWKESVESYRDLIDQFLDQRMTAAEFESKYLSGFKAEQSNLPPEVYEIQVNCSFTLTSLSPMTRKGGRVFQAPRNCLRARKLIVASSKPIAFCGASLNSK